MKLNRKKVKKAILFVVMALVTFVFLIPIYWMVISSLKDNVSIFKIPPELFPKKLYFKNYLEAIEYIPFIKFTKNTIFVSVVSTFGLLLSCPMVAYALAKLKWKGRQVYFVIMLSTMLLPFHVQMVPLYMLYKKLGWIGTYLPLIVPNFFGSALYIFLLRQFMIGIPKELSESAIIDGAGHFRIYGTIVMPLIKPAMFSVALFAFLANWSDFLGPLIFVNQESHYTLSIGLTFYKGTKQTEWAYLLAACTMFTVPIAVLYFFTQRRFIEGITFTGIKG